MEDLPYHVVEKLLRFGLLVMGVTPYQNITMKNLLPQLLDGSAEHNAAIQKAIVPALARSNPSANATESLNGLAMFLKSREPYESTAPETIRSYIITTAVTSIFIALRFYVRRLITGKIRLEDWVILAAFILSASYAVIMSLTETLGHSGLHIWDLSWQMVKENAFWLFLSEIWYPVVHGTIKASILIFYWGLLPNRTFQRAVIAVSTLVAIITLVGICVVTFQCSPVAYWENPLTAKCINRRLVWSGWGVAHIIADFMILFMPMPVIWKLMMKTREKLIICGMFGIGAFVCIASINRVIATDRFIDDPDHTFKEGYPGVWGLYEIDIAIIVACIPALKALVVRYAPKILGTRTHGEIGQVTPPPQGTIGGSGGSRKKETDFDNTKDSNTTYVMSTLEVDRPVTGESGYKRFDSGV